MGRTKPPYTPEFRAEAVSLARSSGRPLSEIAGDLGCSTESVGGQAIMSLGVRRNVSVGGRVPFSFAGGHHLLLAARSCGP